MMWRKDAESGKERVKRMREKDIESRQDKECKIVRARVCVCVCVCVCWRREGEGEY